MSQTIIPVEQDGARTVVRQLVELIQKERLTTGDRLAPIRELATRFGVGANVVRDGLMQAQAMGLVQIQPRSGVVVQSVDFGPMVDVLRETLETALTREDHNLFHLAEARRLIEMDAAPKAAARCRAEDLLPVSQALQAMDRAGGDLQPLIDGDDAFHLGIAAISGNQVYVTILRALLAILKPLREVLVPTAESRTRTRTQHQAIYRALLAGDPAAAREAMGLHLDMPRTYLLDQIESVAANGN
jgi:DNA-binding FadR family transcriptional regulator